jgi:hypothetical protein
VGCRVDPDESGESDESEKPGERGTSGMTCGRRQKGRVNAEQTIGTRQSVFDPRREDDIGVGLDREPGIAGDLVFELPRPPSGLAERDQQPLGSGALRHGFEHILR